MEISRNNRMNISLISQPVAKLNGNGWSSKVFITDNPGICNPKDSIPLPYGITTVGDVEIPFITRKGQPLVPVSTVEDRILSKYPNRLPQELAQRPPSMCYPADKHEVVILNQINKAHSHPFGGPFVDCELLADLKDVREFHNLVQRFLPALDDIFIPYVEAVPGGWLQIENTVVPFLKRINTKKERIRVVPLQVIKHACQLQCDSFKGILEASRSECHLLTIMCHSAGLGFNFLEDTQLIKLNDLINIEKCQLHISMLHGQNPFQQAKINNRSEGGDVRHVPNSDTESIYAEKCKSLQPPKKSSKSSKVLRKSRSLPGTSQPSHVSQDSGTVLDLSLKQRMPPLIPIPALIPPPRPQTPVPELIPINSHTEGRQFPASSGHQEVPSCPPVLRAGRDKRKVKAVTKANGFLPTKRQKVNLPTLDEVVAIINGPHKPSNGKRRTHTLNLTRIKLPPLYQKTSLLQCLELPKQDKLSNSSEADLPSESDSPSEDTSLKDDESR